VVISLARLEKQFSEEQLLELSAQIAFENSRAGFNRVFDLESDQLYGAEQSITGYH